MISEEAVRALELSSWPRQRPDSIVATIKPSGEVWVYAYPGSALICVIPEKGWKAP